jgi:16S rRNA (adenine1518-N6/adenine1519-N6)-dimethyltransferase
VQKEVGERFMAKPKTKEYNSLTIYLNYYFNIYKLFNVSRNVFTPVPNVDSVVMCLEKKEKPTNLENEEIFFKLVKDSFTQKRKTLKNNLKGYDFEKISEILKNNGYEDNVRAEYLPIEMFVNISNIIK